MNIATLALSRVVFEVFNVEKCRDLEIYSLLFTQTPFDAEQPNLTF